jgi:hypothetical protein
MFDYLKKAAACSTIACLAMVTGCSSGTGTTDETKHADNIKSTDTPAD